MTTRLFVYGSLRKGKPNHRLLVKSPLGEATYKGLYKTVSRYYMVGLKSGAYPYVMDIPPHTSMKPIEIVGEVYEVDEECLRVIDQLEGHPEHYRRITVSVREAEGEEVINAAMYILTDNSIKTYIQRAMESGWTRFIPVPSGDWCTALSPPVKN